MSLNQKMLDTTLMLVCESVAYQMTILEAQAQILAKLYDVDVSDSYSQLIEIRDRNLKSLVSRYGLARPDDL